MVAEETVQAPAYQRFVSSAEKRRKGSAVAGTVGRHTLTVEVETVYASGPWQDMVDDELLQLLAAADRVREAAGFFSPGLLRLCQQLRDELDARRKLDAIRQAFAAAAEAVADELGPGYTVTTTAEPPISKETG